MVVDKSLFRCYERLSLQRKVEVIQNTPGFNFLSDANARKLDLSIRNRSLPDGQINSVLNSMMELGIKCFR